MVVGGVDTSTTLPLGFRDGLGGRAAFERDCTVSAKVCRCPQIVGEPNHAASSKVLLVEDTVTLNCGVDPLESPLPGTGISGVELHLSCISTAL